MPHRTPKQIEATIRRLKSAGCNSVVIAKHLRLHHSYSITDRGVRKILSKCNGNNVERRPRNQVKKVKREHVDFVDFLYKQNNELSASVVQEKINYVFGVHMSRSTVKMIRRQLGWTCKQSAYCQMISVKNVQVRKQFAMEMLRKKEDFSDVVFTGKF